MRPSRTSIQTFWDLPIATEFCTCVSRNLGLHIYVYGDVSGWWLGDADGRERVSLCQCCAVGRLTPSLTILFATTVARNAAEDAN